MRRQAVPGLARTGNTDNPADDKRVEAILAREAADYANRIHKSETGELPLVTVYRQAAALLPTGDHHRKSLESSADRIERQLTENRAVLADLTGAHPAPGTLIAWITAEAIQHQKTTRSVVHIILPNWAYLRYDKASRYRRHPKIKLEPIRGSRDDVIIFRDANAHILGESYFPPIDLTPDQAHTYQVLRAEGLTPADAADAARLI
jgi:hypothetical protein